MGPSWGHLRNKGLRGGPKMASGDIKRLHAGPKRHREGLKRPYWGAKRFFIGLKMAPKGQKKAPRRRQDVPGCYSIGQR